jgi:cellulose synthase/poly-beta-1,6-N-acetylglucosamine synthase-like glycosyltransferase
MTALKILFWFSLFVIFYSYIGYGILLYFLVQVKNLFTGNKPQNSGKEIFEPEISLIVSAYNEEDFIERKIKNTLELIYPADKLKIIFITDGSSDNTHQIITRYKNILSLHEPERRGKLAAMNRAMQFVNTPYVIFSDANTLLNVDCIREIAKHYADAKVGGVAGEKKVINDIDDTAAGVGEGLYWKYESFLKKLDSSFHSVVGAAGELFSVRTDLFEKEEKNVIIEDFVQSLKICMKGYVIKYEPNAYAIETSSASMKEEQKRKVRICAGAFQAMAILKGLFNFFKYPVLSFQFISHRILRWTICPVCLVTLLISNVLITINSSERVYSVILVLQICFYICALIGWFFANKNIKLKFLYIPYYFLFMNVAVFLGFKRFMMKQQTVLWEKASRQALA